MRQATKDGTREDARGYPPSGCPTGLADTRYKPKFLSDGAWFIKRCSAQGKQQCELLATQMASEVRWTLRQQAYRFDKRWKCSLESRL